MTSPWAPLARRTFRILWIAQLGGNIGTWMQTVAAQWLLVGQPNAAALVALVQTASMLPGLFLSLPAGVFADILDRRRLLYVTNILLAVCTGVLAVLTFAGPVSPALLLTFTFLLGCGAALIGPAWQAIQPELVPREEIPAASALGSVTINGARVIGPAVAGFLVAWIGPAPVFALNALSFVGIAVAVFAWRQQRGRVVDHENVGEAVAAGLRYLRSAPGVRRIILRSVLFAAPGSALWALLPFVSSSRFGMGASGYGALLGVLGVGAILGVVVLPPLRARWSANALLGASALFFGLATLALVVLPLWVVVPLLVLAGVAWIATLSSLNAAMQLSLPAWVRARGIALYLLAFMGAQAIGALAWGALANSVGVTLTLSISAAALGLAAVSIRVLPLLPHTGQLDRTVVVDWPTPTLVFDPDPRDGPVMITADYRVPPENTSAFLEAMKAVERSRRRTGASRWRLYRDGADEGLFIEVFTVASWAEHLRQHDDRRTGADRDVLAAARDLASDTGREVRHLFPV
jgi:MFS family permease/quinol monooxygenase YgiN